MYITRDNLLYKYVVFSRRMEQVEHPYEYLHGRGGFINRALKIPRNKCIAESESFCDTLFILK